MILTPALVVSPVIEQFAIATVALFFYQIANRYFPGLDIGVPGNKCDSSLADTTLACSECLPFHMGTELSKL